MPGKIPLQFTAIKCKLESVVEDQTARDRITSEAENAHELTKLGLFFFKAYCLGNMLIAF